MEEKDLTLADLALKAKKQYEDICHLSAMAEGRYNYMNRVLNNCDELRASMINERHRITNLLWDFHRDQKEEIIKESDIIIKKLQKMNRMLEKEDKKKKSLQKD